MRIPIVLFMALLLTGCGSTVAHENSKGTAEATPRQTPAWVETIGADCGVLLPDGTPDLEAWCAIGDALYAP